MEGRTFSAGSKLVVTEGARKSRGRSEWRSAEAGRGRQRRWEEAGCAEAMRMKCWAPGGCPGTPVLCAARSDVWVPHRWEGSRFLQLSFPPFTEVVLLLSLLSFFNFELEEACVLEIPVLIIEVHSVCAILGESEGVQFGKVIFRIEFV